MSKKNTQSFSYMSDKALDVYSYKPVNENADLELAFVIPKELPITNHEWICALKDLVYLCCPNIF